MAKVNKLKLSTWYSCTQNSKAKSLVNALRCRKKTLKCSRSLKHKQQAKNLLVAKHGKNRDFA